MRLTPRYLVASLWLLLAGCAVGPDYHEPQRALPGAWSAVDAGAPVAAPAAPVAAVPVSIQAQSAAPDPDWWRGFGDPLLSQLVDRALAANNDLRIAQARVRAARAASAQAAGALWPSVGAYGSATRSSNGGQDAVSAYGLGFDASWEIDLFGRLQRGAEAAGADAQSVQATAAFTQVSVAAEVARTYVELRAYQLRIAITRANLDNQSETLQLTEWRAQAGLVGQLDVEQARANREQTRAQLPVLLNAAAQSRHALALLVDQPPAALDAELAATQTPTIPAGVPIPALGVPAELLRRRPDIVAAERSLAAATERIGEAEAARYPSLSLSGALGLQGAALQALSGSGAATRLIAGGLTAPIFDAGRLRQQVEIRTAEQEQALASYQATLLSALRDVEDARAALANGQVRVEALSQATQAARNAALLANFRYRSGLSDFQTVLDTERSVRTLEDSQASAQADTAIAMVQLYKALGGGWSAPTATTP